MQRELELLGGRVPASHQGGGRAFVCIQSCLHFPCPQCQAAQAPAHTGEHG
jgi:hypothetical protein